MTKDLVPGILFIAFMGLSSLMAFLLLGQAYSGTGSPGKSEIITGQWMVRFEKSLNETLPVYNPSRNFWGRGEYALFKQGRKGVVVGDNGWLFTDEEFSCPRGAGHIMSDHWAFMKTVRDSLQQKGVALAIVPIPAKARVYPEHLGEARIPACRADIYTDTLTYLNSQSIPVINLYAAFRAQPDRGALYLKTDTHWTPEGARLAAKVIAHEVQYPVEEEKKFSSWTGETKTHSGDLLRYLPGVKEISPDPLQQFSTESAAEEAGDLFGDAVPPVTLIGTSYSANSLWNFDGFLKESLKSDVLNMADEGQGPFAVMNKYLNSDTWKNTPPKLVIWEVPERFMTIQDKINEH